MSFSHSSNRIRYEYQPTIIESRVLLRRLAIQISFLNNELKRSWIDCKKDPIAFATYTAHNLLHSLKKLLTTPNVLPACATAVTGVACVVISVLLFETTARVGEPHGELTEVPLEFVLLDVKPQTDLASASRMEKIGKDGSGRVGFQKGSVEGSGPTPRSSRGGGGGGDDDPTPPQVGKLPPPSNILAAIPSSRPLNPPALPVAGIDIDPALWKDLKAPVYGDPRSKSEAESKGPGDGEGIGKGKGTGIGEGDGAGVGPGDGGNIGGGSKALGCCGPGSGSDRWNRTFTPTEVEQRARLLLKPEPKYTEEARRNQISGTVMLRVVFSSAGEVVQIRAVRTLPFGLTERAIAAAREIKFVPATKGGHPVSVFMQLEYNFNLY